MSDHQGAPSSSPPPFVTSSHPPVQEEVLVLTPPQSSEVDPEPEPELVTLNLVQWMETIHFVKLQDEYTDFFRGDTTEDALSERFASLCQASCAEGQIDWSFARNLNEISPTKYWHTAQSKTYAQLVRVRRADLLQDDTTPSQMGTSKRGLAFGPYKPDLRCSWYRKKIWFLIQEAKRDNHSTGLAQLLWYLVFAHEHTGCYLGVVISGALLQRVYICGTMIFMETTDESNSGGTLGIAEVFSDLEDRCPMPLQLFDKATDGTAIPNEQGLGAYLEIVTRANRLAFEAIHQGLVRVPEPISVEEAGDPPLFAITGRTGEHADADVKAITNAEPDTDKKRKYRATDHDNDDHDEDNCDNDRAAGHHKASAKRTTNPASADPPTSRTSGTSTLLSFDAVATLDDVVGQISDDWINNGNPLIDNNNGNPFIDNDIETDSAQQNLDTQDVGRLAPSDSGSWRFEDDDEDEDEVLPSHLILALEALGYRVHLVTVNQMDALIRLPSASMTRNGLT